MASGSGKFMNFRICERRRRAARIQSPTHLEPDQTQAACLNTGHCLGSVGQGPFVDAHSAHPELDHVRQLAIFFIFLKEFFDFFPYLACMAPHPLAVVGSLLVPETSGGGGGITPCLFRARARCTRVSVCEHARALPPRGKTFRDRTNPRARRRPARDGARLAASPRLGPQPLRRASEREAKSRG